MEEHGEVFRDLTPPAMANVVRMRHEERRGQGVLAAVAGETLLLTLSGAAEVVIDGDTVGLARNDFLYLEAQVPCRWRTLSEAPWICIRVRT